jgi:hypothetical protein
MQSTHTRPQSPAAGPLPETMAHFFDSPKDGHSRQQGPALQAGASSGYLKNISTGQSATEGT